MRTTTAAAGEWRSAWPTVLAAAVGQAFGTSHIYSLGLFIAPLEQQFGWSRTQITSGYLLLSAVSILSVPMIGTLMDRIGPRRIALPGMIFYCLGLGMLGLAGPSIWSWWALWLFISIGCAGASTAVWTTAVASRFDRSRGLAIAVVMFGSGASSAFIPLLAQALIEQLDWRGAFLGMATVAAIVTIPLLFLGFRGAIDAGRRLSPDRSSAVATSAVPVRQMILSSRFIRLAIANFAMMIASISLVINFVPIVTGLGIDTTTAAGAASLIGIGSITGRIATGLLLDRMRATQVGAVAFAIPALLPIALLHFGGNLHIIYPVAFLLGLSLGSEVDIIAYVISRYFDRARFGTLFSILVSLQILAGGIGPSIGSLVYDLHGSYDLLLIGLVPAFALAAVIIATLGQPKP